MKLIFIYGPPGVGKLTVAKALHAQLEAQGRRFPLFHNHLVFDLCKVVMGTNWPALFDLAGDIRLSVFEHAARQGKAVDSALDGLIFTYVYGKKSSDDDAFVRDAVKVVEAAGGEILFVQLECERETLLERVEAEDRQPTMKISQADELEQVLLDSRIGETVPFEGVLKIDNTHLSPEEVVEQICNIIS